MTHSAPEPGGWYRDPYGLHQHRWFSAGTPTALVRDQGVESHDDPPEQPPPGPPAEIPEHDQFPADDLRRADEQAAEGAEYDAEQAFEQASDAAVAGGSD